MDYNPHLDNPEAVEHAHGLVNDILQTYQHPDLDEAETLINDLIYGTPDLGTSLSLTSIQHSLRNTREALQSEQGEYREERKALHTASTIIDSEHDQYPAHGTDRHYSLDARQKNL